MAMAPLRAASFNVNGIRARMPVLMSWIQRVQPDILALQETKVPDSEFPLARSRRQGIYAFCWGGNFNGLAVLSRGPIEVLQQGVDHGGPAELRVATHPFIHQEAA